MKRFILILFMGLAAVDAAAEPAPPLPTDMAHLTAPFDLANRSVRLNNGRDMPITGMTVAGLGQTETQARTLAALKNGFRLIETDFGGGSEAVLGRAMRYSGLARKQIFLTVKLPQTRYADAQAALEGMLKRMKVGYIDLVLLDGPAKDDAAAYKALEQMVRSGRVKSIGLSGYGRQPFARIVADASVKPAVLQHEINPLDQKKYLKNFLDQYGTVLQAAAPVGGQAVLEHSAIRKLADKHAKKPEQIVLRWHLQNGNVAVSESVRLPDVKEHENVFNFNLNPEDMRQIAAMD